ncbi:MAG TPA: hypothetical protein VEA78_01135 [Acidimicrobiales bacterium]|nr:hypothetical protein [Acidimicrobiales bacterium]
MYVACWSAKGGSGTTVVAVALATVLARAHPEVLLVDLAGDVPTVLGVPEPEGLGVGDWLDAGEGVPVDALRRLELPGPAGVRVLPRGTIAVDDRRGEVLAALLASEHRPVVVDCGSMPVGARLALAASASTSLLVLRPCYLALRRAAAFGLRPSGVVLLDEPGRAIDAADVEAMLGVPVRALVPVDSSIAASVDAGTFVQRLPRRFEREMRRAA